VPNIKGLGFTVLKKKTFTDGLFSCHGN